MDYINSLRISTGTDTIFISEDDESARFHHKEVMKRFGCNVVVAINREDTIENP